MSDLSGHWELIGYRHISDELPLIDGEPRPDDIRSWLIGSVDVQQGVAAANGLQIEIDGSTFSEAVAEFPELMFDIEGVQVNDYQPMAGRLHFVENVGFIRPDGVPGYAFQPIQNEVASRYSDGDTIVCDTLRRAGTNLTRQISVITDEFYTDRMVLVYQLV
ncbi:MAG: hypothetical protein WBD20_19035 [Pirellulaceae bacterium]